MTSCQHYDKQFNPSEIFIKYFEARKIFTVTYNDKSSLSVAVCVYAQVQTWKSMPPKTEVYFMYGLFQGPG